MMAIGPGAPIFSIKTLRGYSHCARPMTRNRSSSGESSLLKTAIKVSMKHKTKHAPPPITGRKPWLFFWRATKAMAIAATPNNTARICVIDHPQSNSYKVRVIGVKSSVSSQHIHYKQKQVRLQVAGLFSREIHSFCFDNRIKIPSVESGAAGADRFLEALGTGAAEQGHRPRGVGEDKGEGHGAAA